MFNNIEVVTFASVFHGIRFKVRRLFVGTTSNFFCPYEKAASPQFHNDCFMEKIRSCAIKAQLLFVLMYGVGMTGAFS